MDLSAYTLTTLHQDGEFVLCRGRAIVSPSPHPSSILVRVPASEHPVPARLRMLEHELGFRDDLDSSWALRPIALAQHEGRPALILEDRAGEPLARLLDTPAATNQRSDRPSAARAMDLDLFLRLAVGLARALTEVHRRGVVHQNVKPAHVLVNAATAQVWLTGFGIASRLPRHRQSPEPAESLADTLAYMAPEQTGRMNRSIDARSDFYALGVTLYQMLTGSLPFTAAEPIEWVHCHIARQPVAPNERVANVPAAVSAIIMKLLAKAGEDRYQTGIGLDRDLRRCLTQWETERRIHDFPCGEHDTPDRLVIPEKLYGRAREVETLLSAFDRVVRGSSAELVLVSGYSGIGKSSVVNELHKVLVPPRGLFAAGKFDQYKRDIPYSTVAQAFQSLIRPLLAKSDVELSAWREALREALGPNGQLMVDLVPELKLIIGEQAPVPELPPQDAQRRFQWVFRRFLAVFARPEHPLALFLDDLQWLDAATLDLLEDLLITPDVRHVLLIGAYRDNEVTPAHPLIRTVETIRHAGGLIQEIELAPLSGDSIGQLIAESLHCEPECLLRLSELVHEKTGGNPFFVIQFLTALFEEGLLRFDQEAERWIWDLDRIHAKRYTDNIVDLMVRKLERLPLRTQRILQQLACLGNSAAFARLVVVHESSSEELRRDLHDALRSELVLDEEASYRFLHDRVQEAAYSLIPEAERAAAHLRIGRLLIAHLPAEEHEEAIFEIVNQLNRGVALITSRDEKEQLAELNLIAGKRAKASTAYVSALNYLVAGTTLLSDDGWNRRPDRMFALELNRAECEFLTGELPAAEARLTMLVSRAINSIDRATVACLRIDLYMMLDRNDLAVDVCLAYLRFSGIEWSSAPTDEQARREYDRTLSLLGGRDIERLIDLPVMSDPAVVATLDVLTKALTPALYTNANVLSLLVCQMINLSLKHGNTDGSCLAYVWLGRVAGYRFGNYQDGFRFGRLGYDLVGRSGLERFKARTYISFGNFCMPWAEHVRAGREMIRRAFDAANTNGDLTHGAFSCNNLVANLLASGDPLGDVQREAERGLAFAQRARFGAVIDLIVTQLGFIRTLRGLTATFGCFNEAQFDERRFERRLSSGSTPGAPIAACRYWIRKLQARFFANDYAAAVDASRHVQALLWTTPSVVEMADAHFYGALSRAACCDAGSADERQQHVEALDAHYRQLVEWVEKCCAENFANRASLVGAEIARIEGRELDAERLYEAAIQSAHESGFVQNEALANELASRFYAARGFDRIAKGYMRDARHGYRQWGADGKVRQLEAQYAYLAHEPQASDPTQTVMTPVEFLDLSTVLKVSQAVQGETNLEQLIAAIMRLALEDAGADRGLLILPHGDGYRIEAHARSSHEGVTVDLRHESVENGELPHSVFQYVLRTHERVLLGGPSAASELADDEYLRRHHARSVLCIPLLKQTRLTGILYLENSLTSDAFTPARMALLEVLASEAAISLESAGLYHDLQERERGLRMIMNSIPGLVATLTPVGEVEAVTEQVITYFGQTLEELRQWATNDTVHPDDLPRVIATLSNSIASGEPYEIVHRIRRLDGVYRWFQVRGLPLRDVNGSVIRWHMLFTDIDDLKRAEAELGVLKDQLYRENLVLRDEVDRVSMFEEIVGASKTLKGVLSRIAKVAPTDSTVFVSGETGTGKELIARAVHKRSQRAGRAFVSVNCAALAPTLISSELFGHEKGAFTGATQRRLGRFELADGGTIFLDEVGELLPDTQAMLLRVLQEREFERVGGTRSLQVDVRVIAATNRDLKAAIAAGSFRQDLYYRLNVFPIEVPPLRERKDDLLMLVEYFVQRYASRTGRPIRSIDKKTLDLFQAYDWPGNIRELQNVIERSVILSSGGVFTIDELWLSTQSSQALHPMTASAPSRGEPRSERDTIEAALAESRGRIAGPSGAAARLNIPASTLESRIKSLKINKTQFKFGRRPSGDHRDNR
jgi:PAS domain S-box-containing protein